MSAKEYTPVPGPNMRQIARGVLLGDVVRAEKWNSLTFSEAFKDRYGVPVTYLSFWDRLTSYPCRRELLPLLQSAIFEVPIHTDLVHFYNTVDSKCVGLGCKVLDRMEMEALYTQFLLRGFDEIEDTRH